MLASLVGRDLTLEEEGESKALLTRLYIKLTNAINEAYLETLKDSIAKLNIWRGLLSVSISGGDLQPFLQLSR